MLTRNTQRLGLTIITLLCLQCLAIGQQIFAEETYRDGAARGDTPDLTGLKAVYADSADLTTNVDLSRDIREALAMSAEWQGTFQPPAGATWLDERQNFINHCVDYFAAIYPGPWERPTLESLRRDGARLIQTGCNDAVVLMFYGLILDEMGLSNDAVPWLRQGYYEASHYYTPTLHLLRGMCAARLSETHYRLGDATTAYRYNALITARILSIFSAEEFGEDALQPALFELLRYYCLPALKDDQYQDLNNRLRWCEYSPEWTCKMIAGSYFLASRIELGPQLDDPYTTIYFEQSLQARSAGQYNLSDTYLRKALQYFASAYDLHPEWPQAAASLVMVSGCTGNTYGAITWFKEAVASQIDYLPAYEGLIASQGYLPAWQRSNNRSAMAAIAAVWAESDRFDTIVPAMSLAMTLELKSSPPRSGYSGYNNVVLPDKPLRDAFGNQRPQLKRLAEGYTGPDVPASVIQWAGPLLATAYYDQKDWSNLLDVSRLLVDQPSAMTRWAVLLRPYDVIPALAVGQAMMETGPRAQLLSEAREAYKGSLYDKALNILLTASQQSDVPADERCYLNESIRRILTARELRAGRWVNIMPSPTMQHWQNRGTDAWVNSRGELIMAGNSYNNQLYYARSVGATFEVRGTLSSASNVNVSLISPNSYYPTNMVISRNEQTVSLMRSNWDRMSSNPVTLTETNRFHLSVWKQRVGFGINDEWLTSNVFSTYLRTDENNIIGIMTDSQTPARISDLQIRQLTLAPTGKGVFDTTESPDPISGVLTGLTASAELPGSLNLESGMVRHRSVRRGQISLPSPADLLSAATDGPDYATFFNQAPAVTILKLPVVPPLPEEHVGADPDFTDTPPLPGYLLGFRLRMGDNTASIQSIQPIYQTAFGYHLGGRNGDGVSAPIDVRAAPGYAVGGVVCYDASPIAGLQVIFMRVKPDGTLDTTDTYRSAWCGSFVGTREIRSDGRAVVGMVGTCDRNRVNSLGLVFADRADLTDIDLPDTAVPEPQLPELSIPASRVIERNGAYYYLTSTLTLAEARYHAELLGGTLLTPQTPDESALAAMWAQRWRLPVWVDVVDAEGNQWASAVTGEIVPVVPVNHFSDLRAAAAPPTTAASGVALWTPDMTGQFVLAAACNTFPAIIKFASDPRPADQRQPVREFNGTWYATVPYVTTFNQAQAICQAAGGQLATIPDAETNAFLASMTSDTAFIGITLDDETSATWMDQTPFDFSAARSSRLTDYPPNSAGVTYGSDARWEFYPAPAAKLWFICQWDEEPPADIMNRLWQLYRATPPDVSAADTASPGSAAKLDPIEYNGHWYQGFYDYLSWAEAQAHCESLGGHLIFIDDADENAFAMLFVDTMGRLWIGATDEATEGEWLWADGSAVTFTAWASGEPNDSGGEDHADLIIMGDSTPQWNDLPGDVGTQSFTGVLGLPYICEWDHDPTATNGMIEPDDEEGVADEP